MKRVDEHGDQDDRRGQDVDGQRLVAAEPLANASPAGNGDWGDKAGAGPPADALLVVCILVRQYPLLTARSAPQHRESGGASIGKGAAWPPPG